MTERAKASIDGGVRGPDVSGSPRETIPRAPWLPPVGRGLPAASVGTEARSQPFAARPEDRYWWHRFPRASFVPPLYGFLTDEEWATLDAWFRDTDARRMHGEAQIPALSMLLGLITGSQIANVVQLGAYAGYSSLLVGFMMRHMGLRHAALSVDHEPEHCEYTCSWLRRAGLEEHVRVECADSVAPHLPALARRQFGGGIELVFVDSSHEYAHTLRELDAWFPELVPGGFLLLHDASDWAATLDPSGAGGVRRAFTEWQARNPGVPAMSLNPRLAGLGSPLVYKDGCGLGIVQRPG